MFYVYAKYVILSFLSNKKYIWKHFLILIFLYKLNQSNVGGGRQDLWAVWGITISTLRRPDIAQLRSDSNRSGRLVDCLLVSLYLWSLARLYVLSCQVMSGFVAFSHWIWSNSNDSHESRYIKWHTGTGPVLQLLISSNFNGHLYSLFSILNELW